MGEGVIFFLLGAVVTALVASYIYLRQKKEFNQSEAKLLHLLEKQMQQISSTSVDVDVIKKSQYQIQDDFIYVKDALTRVLKITNGEGFSAIASALARRKIPNLIHSLPKVTSLSIDLICDMHRRLYSHKPEMAGVIRQKEVWVGNRDKRESLFIPPPPKEISARITVLLDNWNSGVLGIQKSSLQEKLRAIAQFHWEFVYIHPFLDGNGSLAKLITCIQIRDLIGGTIHVDIMSLEHNHEYYLAIEAAKKGDINPLVESIKQLFELDKEF